MTYKEALRIYLKTSVHARSQIERLQKWDVKKTMIENAKALKVSPAMVSFLSRKYKLDYKKLKYTIKEEINGPKT